MKCSVILYVFSCIVNDDLLTECPILMSKVCVLRMILIAAHAIYEILKVNRGSTAVDYILISKKSA